MDQAKHLLLKHCIMAAICVHLKHICHERLFTQKLMALACPSILQAAVVLIHFRSALVAIKRAVKLNASARRFL